MVSAYYLTAEPVGACACHACICSGCPFCDDSDPEDTE